MFTVFSAKLALPTELSLSIFIAHPLNRGRQTSLLHCRQLPEPSSCLRGRRFLGRNPIDFFLQVLFSKANALENTLAVFDHVGMATQVSNGISAVESP